MLALYSNITTGIKEENHNRRGEGNMVKPNKLKKGDKVAIVSLSSGMIGEKKFLHHFKMQGM